MIQLLTTEQIEELTDRIAWAADLTPEQTETVQDNITDWLLSI